MEDLNETPLVPPPIPAAIGRYQILEVIGHGGMAFVYRALDPKFSREVAVKILPPVLLMDPVFKQRFLRETKVISTLEHSAIVPVYDFGEEGEQPYLVMRYLAGGSLLSRLATGPISLAEAARITERIGLALDAAHSRGIIHRDVKPANILFDQFDEVYLTDFGIVQLSQATNPLTGSLLIGTPFYMSPEQIKGGAKIDHRSDIYSLGIVLFEALSGKVPFTADTPAQVMMMHLNDPIPVLSQARPDLPPEIDEILLRALAKDPKQRFGKASDIGQALRAVSIRKELRATEIFSGTTIQASPSGEKTEADVRAPAAPPEKAPPAGGVGGGQEKPPSPPVRGRRAIPKPIQVSRGGLLGCLAATIIGFVVLALLSLGSNGGLSSLFISESQTPTASTRTPTAHPSTTPTVAGPPTKTPTATPLPSGDIAFWYMPIGDDPAGLMQTEIREFNHLYPDVRVNAELVQWNDAYSRLESAAKGIDAPCVSQVGTTWVASLGIKNNIHTFSQSEVDELGGLEAFPNASGLTTMAGQKIAAIPWLIDTKAIAYRKDVFLRAGVDTNWAFASTDNFISALEKIRDSGQNISAFVHPGRNDWSVQWNGALWIWANGGDIITQKNGKWQAAFNSDAAIQGLKEYYSLYGKGLTPSDTLSLNPLSTDARFGQAANAASVITEPWSISYARNLFATKWVSTVSNNLAYAEFPAGPGGQFGVVGGSNLMIFKNCPNHAAAWAWVKYLVSKGSQMRYPKAVGMLPAATVVLHDPIYFNDPWYSVFVHTLDHGKNYSDVPQWSSIETELISALNALWDDVARAGRNGRGIDENTVRSRMDPAAIRVNRILQE